MKPYYGQGAGNYDGMKRPDTGYSRHRWRVEGVHGEAKTRTWSYAGCKTWFDERCYSGIYDGNSNEPEASVHAYLTFCGLKTMCLVSNKNLRIREYSQMDIGVVVKKTDLMLSWLLDYLKQDFFNSPAVPINGSH